MRNVSRKDLITALFLALFLTALLVSVAWGVSELTGASFKDAAASVQGIGTIVALSVAGAFAYYRWHVFRSFEPHLTITHEVSHRRVGDSFVHIAVSADLRNSSRVKVDTRKRYFRLQQVSPTEEPEVERLYDQVFTDPEVDEIQWPTLDDISQEWQDDPIFVEPGETHREVMEFIVSTEVKTVLIYTYFYNSAASAKVRGAEGWDATTIYDIVTV